MLKEKKEARHSYLPQKLDEGGGTEKKKKK